MRASTAALLFVLGGCGADGAGYTDGGSPDARPGDAGVPVCNVNITVTPLVPVAPVTLVATATSTRPGFISMNWRILGPQGGELQEMALDSTGLRVSVPAMTAGPYNVGGTATVSSMPCPVVPANVNVRATAPRSLEVRLRYAPLPTQAVPTQVDPQTVTVLGGADYALPAPRVLDGGSTVGGRVTGPSGGLGAFLRLDGAGAGVFELYADGAGAYSGRVPPATYDVLVVPFGAGVPPARFVGLSTQLLSQGLTLMDGDLVSGVTLTDGGEPVAGARIAIATGSLPPAIVVTDEDGAFSARVRTAAGPLAMTVIPPAPHARVTAPAGITLSAGAMIEVRLPSADTVEVAPVLRTADGAAAPGARVTFAGGAVTPSGSIRIGAAAPVDAFATMRASFTAGEGGAIAPLRLPRASYDVVVDPPPGSSDVPRQTVVDLSAGDPPAALSSGQRGTTRLTVRDAAMVPVGNVQVVAVARGLRGVGAGQAVFGTTSASGALDLLLAPGMTYDVTVDPPVDRRLARARTTIVGGAAQASATVPAALFLRGTVVFPAGGGQAGVRVEALCTSCPDPTLPLAETATSAAGQFELRLPDPGVVGP